MRLRLRTGITLCLALAIGACNFSEFENNPLGGGELTVDKEKEVTADVASQIRGAIPLVGDPVLLAYLNELGQKIVEVTEPQPFVYRFGLLNDDTLNAFTIGGGYVYLNSGVVSQAGDVAELVGVLAHEVAHVRNRHIAKRNEGQGLATLATLATLAAAALGGGNPALIAIPQGVNVALQLKNTRINEREADRAGLEYMIEAGYDPHGMVRFFERILAANPSRGGEIPPYLYSHPAIKERIAGGRAQIRRMTEQDPGLRIDTLRRTDARLPEMQARLAALLEPVAGGSGLHARLQFDRTHTDPLLERAKQARKDGDTAAALEALAEAAELEPNDPRVPLARAEIAQEAEDLEAARDALHRAFELDPSVPLVQHQLGLIHKRLGNRTQAVFYLEQAVANFRPNTAARKRAEFDIDLLSFPLFDKSGLFADGGLVDGGRVTRGTPLRWTAVLARRFLARNPEVDVRWHPPGGGKPIKLSLRMNPLGRFNVDFEGDTVGAWRVTVEVRGTPIEEHRFELVPARAP